MTGWINRRDKEWIDGRRKDRGIVEEKVMVIKMHGWMDGWVIYVCMYFGMFYVCIDERSMNV